LWGKCGCDKENVRWYVKEGDLQREQPVPRKKLVLVACVGGWVGEWVHACECEQH